MKDQKVQPQILSQQPIYLDWGPKGNRTNSDDKEGQNLIADTYSRYITLLTFLGTFPISMDKKRNFKIKFVSVRYVYSAIFCCLRVVSGIFVAKLAIGNMSFQKVTLESNSVHGFILSYPIAQLVLVLGFLEAPKVARYLQDWTYFQNRFEKITKQPFPKVPSRMFIFVTIFLILSVCTVLFGFPDLDSIEETQQQRYVHKILVIMTIFSGFSMVVQSHFWIFMIYVLNHSAKVLWNEIESTRWITDKSLKNLILLWYNLRQLCKDAGNVLCWTTLYLCAVILAYSIPSIYMGAVVNPMNLVSALVTLFFISLFAEIAHRTARKVGPELEDKLVKLVLRGKGRGYEEELLTFAQTIAANPPAIVLGGFFTLDRGINIPLYSSVVTYLIVLVQFQQG